MKNTRVAIIGCGDIAGGYDQRKKGEGVFSHAGAYRMFPQIEISAAYDVDPKRCKQFCKYWKIRKTCRSLEELTHDSYDIISVCTPDHTHESVLKKVLQRKCCRVIWTEKPLALSARSAADVVSRAKQSKISMWLNNQRRWEKEHARLRQDIGRGMIGEVMYVAGYHVKGSTHIGCTIVDTLRMLIGEVSWVQAYPPFDKGCYGADRSLRGTIGFVRGNSGAIVGCDTRAYTYSIFEIDIIGSLGRIKIEENGDRIKIYLAQEYKHYPGFKELVFSEERKTDMAWAMEKELTYILHDMHSGKYSCASAEEGIKDLRVIDALKESARRAGKRISIVPLQKK